MLDGLRTGLPLSLCTAPTFEVPGAATGTAPVLFLFRFCTRFCTAPPPPLCGAPRPARARRGPRIAPACAEPVREIDVFPEPRTMSSAPLPAAPCTCGDGLRDDPIPGEAPPLARFCGVGGITCVVRAGGMPGEDLMLDVADIITSESSDVSGGGSAKAGRGGRSSISGGGSLKVGLGGRLSNSGGGSLNDGLWRGGSNGGGGGGAANTGGGGGGVIAFPKTGGGGGRTKGAAEDTTLGTKGGGGGTAAGAGLGAVTGGGGGGAILLLLDTSDCVRIWPASEGFCATCCATSSCWASAPTDILLLLKRISMGAVRFLTGTLRSDSRFLRAMVGGSRVS